MLRTISEVVGTTTDRSTEDGQEGEQDRDGTAPLCGSIARTTSPARP